MNENNNPFKYTGNKDGKIDEKFRVVIPSNFVSEFKNRNRFYYDTMDGFFQAPSLEYINKNAAFQVPENSETKHVKLIDMIEFYKLTKFDNITQIPVASNARINIPKEIREYLNLEIGDSINFHGKGNYIELTKNSK